MITYIEKLLKGQPVEWKTLGEVGTFVRGSGLQKKDLKDSGVPAIHYGQIYTYYGRSTNKTKSFVTEDFAEKSRLASPGDLVIATTSENDDDVCKAVAWLGEGALVVSSDACFYAHTLHPKYIAYIFESHIFQDQKRKFITGTKVRRVNVRDLARISIPIPPLSVQEEIVRILDKFTELEAELEARKQQYEYYRNSLLSFANDLEGG
ncbi:restriction endonuclease subunit S [Porphyromonas sp.]|uniref:restriction endonuclease subunit S n=2 Tax=Porphyromonas sp. TaxID=1924944 RepID=UPI00257E5D42|nr:restriction endonuclease subunit S [Porphyromonas sp.]